MSFTKEDTERLKLLFEDRFLQTLASDAQQFRDILAFVGCVESSDMWRLKLLVSRSLLSELYEKVEGSGVKLHEKLREILASVLQSLRDKGYVLYVTTENSSWRLHSFELIASVNGSLQMDYDTSVATYEVVCRFIATRVEGGEKVENPHEFFARIGNLLDAFERDSAS